MANHSWKWERWMEEEKTDSEWAMEEMDPYSKERRAGRDLKPLDMSWLKGKIFDRNAALAPPREKWPKHPKDLLGQQDPRDQQPVPGVLDFS